VVLSVKEAIMTDWLGSSDDTSSFHFEAPLLPLLFTVATAAHVAALWPQSLQ
jgi:hypothetical protein